MERFLKRCIDCDREFFTEGERSFYRSKDLVEPRRCKECREKRRLGNQSELYDAQPILDEIASTWKLEAKQEQSNLFYYVDEVNELLNGNKSYVIGRKGMGKTAIGEYIYQNKEATVFSERLSFKNFPFNMLYGLDNKQYTQPNQYITIWKYLIYSSICKMMIKNEAIDKQLRQKLEKIYTKEPIKALNKMVERWTADEFGMEVFGVGGSIGGIKKVQQDLAWIEKTSILEDVIEGYIDQSNYYIVVRQIKCCCILHFK